MSPLYPVACWLLVGGDGVGDAGVADDGGGGGGDGGDIDGDGGCGGGDDEAILVSWERSPKRHAVGGGLHVRVSFSLRLSLRLTPTARPKKRPDPLVVEMRSLGPCFAVRRLLTEGLQYW